MKFHQRNLVRNRLEEWLGAADLSGRVLDVGCGNSRYSHLAADRVGVDHVFGKGVEVVADIHQLPFRDRSFDQVLCTEVLEHCAEPPGAIDELCRVLDQGGTCYLTTRFLFPVHEQPWDFHRFTAFGLERLFEGWSQATITAENSVFSSIAVLIQRAAWQTELRGGRLTRLLLLALAQGCARLDTLVVKQWGDRRRSVEGAPFSSGYYVRAER